jgi:P27 family predicted phage terminase small subunit
MPTRVPEGLTSQGRSLWRALIEELELVHGGYGAAQLLVLEEIVRARDRLAEIRERITEDGATVRGSRRQIRPHPLLAFERRLVLEVDRGISRLQLTPFRRQSAVAIRQARDLTR